MTPPRPPVLARWWVRVFLAALVAVWAVLGLATTASAATEVGAENRVRASSITIEVPVEPPEGITPSQQLGNNPCRTVTTAATGVAGKHVLPKALSGEPADTHVYLGIRNGRPVYAGISNNLARRQAQHGGRFVLEEVTTSPVTRGEARAIEQALIVRNGATFENKINSISPNHSYYNDAVNWGEAWLKQNGY